MNRSALSFCQRTDTTDINHPGAGNAGQTVLDEARLKGVIELALTPEQGSRDHLRSIAGDAVLTLPSRPVVYAGIASIAPDALQRDAGL